MCEYLFGFHTKSANRGNPLFAKETASRFLCKQPACL